MPSASPIIAAGVVNRRLFDKCSWSQSAYSVLDSVVDVVIVLGVDIQVNLAGVLSVRAFSRCSSICGVVGVVTAVW